MVDSLEKLVALAKRRGFVYPGSEMYGGLANSWDYGPLGVELRNNIRQLWWSWLVKRRDDIVGLEAALIMNPKVWEASGHVSTFHDPLVEDKQTHERFRLDHLLEEQGIDVSGMSFEQMAKKMRDLGLKSAAGNELTDPKQFNMMLQTHLGPVSDENNAAYLRPETAQAMFVDFKNVVGTSRKKLPFGIAQVGKSFRNEITPGNFIFRTREFEQMELEYFFAPPKDDAEWQEYFAYWQAQMWDWVKMIGLTAAHVHEVEVGEADRAHYSKKTVDFEYDFPFGTKELYGLAYRTDFDLKNHEAFTGQNTKYRNQETNEEYWPHVIEPTWGVDRTMLAVLCEAYTEEEDRVVLKLPKILAPYKAAVFPLLANKPQLVEKARGIYESLRETSMVVWDDRGNIGKRYKAQDEIGTPYCVTIDFDSLDDDSVTIRDRDTQEQRRVSIAAIPDLLF